MIENKPEIKGRFHPSITLPEVPEGKELHKFYGQPVLLTAMEEGEPMYGNSPYTVRQARELEELAELTKGINPESTLAETIRTAFAERPVSAINKIAVNGVLMAPNVPVDISQVQA